MIKRFPLSGARVGRRLHLASLVGITMLLAGCFDKQPEHQNLPAHHGETASVSAIELDATTAEVFSRYPATVVARDQSPIASRMMGFVQHIAVDAGDAVEQGDLLLQIDQADVDSQIEQARAMLAQAESGLADAQRSYNRAKNLFEQEALPKQQFEQSQTGLEQARAQVQRARAGLEQAQTQTRYTEITAPFSGLVVERMIQPGQLATPGQPMLMIQSAGAKEISVDLDRAAYQHLNADSTLLVTYRDLSGAEQQFDAPVLRRVDAANPMTRTHAVSLAVPESHDINAGQFVMVSVPVAQQQQILIPSQALEHRAGLTGVFVVDEHDYARFRLVQTGRTEGERVAILSGLQAGDRLITKSDRHLINGLKVEVDAAL